MSIGLSNFDIPCILCGRCLEVCPLLAATGREELGPRAKGHMARELVTDPESLSEKDVAELAGLCLGCGRCQDVCPQGVDIPDIVARLRAAHPGFARWVWKQWMGGKESLWPIAGSVARTIPVSALSGRLGLALKSLHGLASCSVPAFVEIKKYPDEFRGQEALFFAGCTAEHLARSWKSKALEMMSGMGVRRIEAEFPCCGLSSSLAGIDSSGDAGRIVEVWRAAGRPMMVTICASCSHQLARYLANGLFEDDAEHRLWLDRLTPMSALLMNGDFVLSDNAPGTTLYHRPCHATRPDPDLEFLMDIVGSGFGTGPEKGCCGFGGIMQLGSPALAGQVSERCWSALAPNPGDVVLSGCSACVGQLSGTAPKEVSVGHWLEIFR